MTRAADRFEPVEGRAVGAVPSFRLEDRVVEELVSGTATTWIVIPALDEGKTISATLAAIEGQAFRPFVLCVVDNGSADETAELVRAWARSLPERATGAGIGVRLAHEPEKGTGAAADTGMRIAAAAGATNLLRTDADTLPRR